MLGLLEITKNAITRKTITAPIKEPMTIPATAPDESFFPVLSSPIESPVVKTPDCVFPDEEETAFTPVVKRATPVVACGFVPPVVAPVRPEVMGDLEVVTRPLVLTPLVEMQTQSP